jgi:hypothetical protein
LIEYFASAPLKSWPFTLSFSEFFNEFHDETNKPSAPDIIAALVRMLTEGRNAIENCRIDANAVANSTGFWYLEIS